MKRVMFPGSFDPIHFGHMQVVDKALNLFDEVYIAVLVNVEKERTGNILLSINERVKIIKELYKDNPRVKVIYSHRLNATELYYKYKCDAIVRGIRSETDFASEERFCKMINELSHNSIEVIHLITVGTYTSTLRYDPWAISSSLIKKRIKDNKSIKGFCPDVVIRYLRRKIHYDVD